MRNMRTWVILLPLVGLTATRFEVPSEADPRVQEREVVAAVQRLFDGMLERDTASIARVLHPDAPLVSTRVVEGRTVVRRVTAAQFLSSIAQAQDSVLERMWDPEVRIDGDIATLWAPYDLHLGSRFSHCGYDAFHLVRENGTWRITSIIYTVRSEGCEAIERS